MFSFRHNRIPSNSAFSLIELMVVITIITFLVGILYLPMQYIRDEAKSLLCLNHLRATVEAVTLQAAEEGRYYPAAYEFINGSTETGGYVTWAGTLIRDGYLSEDGVTCPVFSSYGGLPAANPAFGWNCDGQVSETVGVVDVAPNRCAYTLNEAVCPQPRFPTNGNYAQPARRVSMDEVESDVILATEFGTDWRVTSPGDDTCRSYLPVHGVIAIGQTGSDKYDLYTVVKTNKPCFKDGCYRRCNPDLLVPQPITNLDTPPRMNLIGRNHGRCDSDGFRRTSFAFVDGHAVSSTAPDTLTTNFWGHRVYSVTGDQRIVDR